MERRASIILSATVLLVLAVTSSAFAKATGWAEDAGGRMRVIVTPPTEDGTIRAALQIEPDEGFITYWREPGGGGIPPQIDVSGTKDVRLETIDYPVPQRLKVGGVTEMGYDGPVTFPLTLKAKPGGLPKMTVSAFVGLCKDICIPFQASFEISASPSVYAAGPVEKAILAVTATSLPQGPSSDRKIISAFETDKALKLNLRLPEDTDLSPELTLANSEGFIVEVPHGKWENGLYFVSVPLAALPKDTDVQAGNWSLLAKTSAGAFETPLVFEQRRP